MEIEFSFFSDHFGRGDFQAELRVTICCDRKGFRFDDIVDPYEGSHLLFSDLPEPEQGGLIMQAEKLWMDIDWNFIDAERRADDWLDFHRENQV